MTNSSTIPWSRVILVLLSGSSQWVLAGAQMPKACMARGLRQLFWPEQCRRCWLQFHIGKVSSTWTSAFVLDTDPSGVGMGTVLSQMGSDLQKSWTMLLCDTQVASCCSESQGASLSGGWCPSRKPKGRLQPSWRSWNGSTELWQSDWSFSLQSISVIGKGSFHSLRGREQESLLLLGQALLLYSATESGVFCPMVVTH